MDELQDAIQDAQYIGAVTDPTPRPTRPLILCDTPTAMEFVRRKETKDPNYFSLQAICSMPLGFYLFKKYCEAQGAEVSMRFQFVEDVVDFRRRTLPTHRLQLAYAIHDVYFVSYAMRTTPAHPNDGKMRRLRTEVGAGCEGYEMYCRGVKGANALEVRGPPMERVAQTVAELRAGEAKQHEDEDGSSSAQVGAVHVLSPHLYDEVEEIVFESFAQEHLAAFRESDWFVKLIKFLVLQQHPVGEDDFAPFRVLGRGGFGLVNGCKKANTGRLYAMKVLNKKRIKARNAADLCLNERNVLAMVDSPFVVCLKYAFTTKQDVYLVLDLMTGGDLSFHLMKESPFPPERAKFYAAQVLLGLAHLHANDIVYRDLKPENILMDEHGNTRISDLGLACFMTPNLQGRCGTRGYWAPEMLRKNPDGSRQTYDRMVDWWSFGCLIYEMLFGKCPFRTLRAKSLVKDKQQSMDKATLEMEPDYEFDVFDEDAKDLLRELLNKEPRKRLGATGVDAIKNHPWFADIDWGAMEAGQVAPPFVPGQDINAASQNDIGSFESVGSKVTITDEDHHLYDSWTWTSPSAFQQEIVTFLVWEERQGPIVPMVTNDSCCLIL